MNIYNLKISDEKLKIIENDAIFFNRFNTKAVEGFKFRYKRLSKKLFPEYYL